MMNIVNEANLNSVRYNKSIDHLLREILEPVFSHLGFNHFVYNRFIPGTQYIGLWTDADKSNQYFEQNLDQYLFFEHIIIPKNTKRIVIWDLEKDNALLSFLRGLNYAHGISIYKRDEDYIESWTFATSVNNHHINTFYTNHLDLLEKFIVYFQERAREIIDYSDTSRMAMYTENRSFILSDSDTKVNYDPYLQSITPKQYLFNIDGQRVALTRSEFECLKGFSEGMTAKYIALKKNISYRTVEAHISNAKQKFNVFSKSRLLEEFKKSPYTTF